MRLRGQIVAANLALVLAMARRMRHSVLDYGEMIGEGHVALMRTVDRFDVSRGFKFSTYACQSILKAISRAAVRDSRYRERIRAGDGGK